MPWSMHEYIQGMILKFLCLLLVYFSCLFCFHVFEDGGNLVTGNNVSWFYSICDEGATTAIHVCA